MVLNRQRKVPFRRREVAEFLARLQAEVAGGREIALCVVSDAAMRRYNRRFRAHDAPTDVLSFPPGQTSAGASRRAGTPCAGMAGDLLVSAETARRQARRVGHSVEEEMKILALHGALHLLGYDHERDNGEMARLERRWRRRLGLSPALTERV